MDLSQLDTPAFYLRREARKKQLEEELRKIDQKVSTPVVEMDKRFKNHVLHAHSSLDLIEGKRYNHEDDF